MAIVLTYSEKIDGQSIEIAVEYDVKNFEVEGIDAVYVIAGCVCVDVWPIFSQIPEMDVAINKIVDRVDWRELYTETVNQ